MKRILQRLLVGSLVVLTLFGSYSTRAFARNYTIKQIEDLLDQLGWSSKPSRLDWDEAGSSFIILSKEASDPDPFPYLKFEPEIPAEAPVYIQQSLVIKSDDSAVHEVVLIGERGKDIQGFISAEIIGTERIIKCCQWNSDLYKFQHDGSTGVFDKTENNVPGLSGTVTWHCYYAKDKVKPASAPETTEINEYKVIPQNGDTPEKWEITLPFNEESKPPLFSGTAVLYDWNRNEITSSKYKAGDKSVQFSGTAFDNIIPGYTYYVQAVPDKGIDCDDEGYVYESFGTPGAMVPFALGCLGSDYVDLENAFDSFAINYGYKDDNSGYEPALKWNGKVDPDSSLLIKPLNTEKDWIIENVDEGDGISSAVPSASLGTTPRCSLLANRSSEMRFFRNHF